MFRKHVVFGKLVHGREILRDMELVDTDDSNKPLVPVKIVNCGEVHSGKSESLIADKGNKLIHLSILLYYISLDRYLFKNNYLV